MIGYLFEKDLSTKNHKTHNYGFKTSNLYGRKRWWVATGYLQNGYFRIENRREIIKVNISDIYYFEKIKGTHNTCVVFAGGLSTFRSDLQDVKLQFESSGYINFLQCHKAFIVNMANVRRIQKHQNGYTLHFDNGQSCPCSVFYKKAVANWNP